MSIAKALGLTNEQFLKLIKKDGNKDKEKWDIEKSDPAKDLKEAWEKLRGY